MFVPEGLSPVLRDRYTRAAKDPRRFIRLMRIYHKEQRKILPFDLNGAQIDLLEALMLHKRIIVLKARQMGMSTVIRAYIFWQLYVAEEPIQWGTLLHHEKSFKAFQRIDEIFIKNMPTLLKRDITSAVTHYMFNDTGTGHEKFTARSDTGTRAFVFGAAHLSEFAFYPDQEDTLAIVDATVGDGQIVIETTPDAPGDHFYHLCMEAPGNGWTLVTYWWWQHAPYSSAATEGFKRTDAERAIEKRYDTKLTDGQLQWRREKIATTGLSKFMREYPGSIEDAFSFPEAAYFETPDIDAIGSVLKPNDAGEYVTGEFSEFDDYILASDVAAGVGGDYTGIKIISASTLQQVYSWRSNTITPEETAERIVFLASKWGNPLVIVESEKYGAQTLQRLRLLNYTRLWQSTDGKDWVTNAKSKLDMYGNLRSFIRERVISELDLLTLMELRSLRVERVTPEAPQGLHDDLADTLALAYRALRDLPRSALTQSRKRTNPIDELKRKRRRTARRGG